MLKWRAGLMGAGFVLVATVAQAADKPLLGIVSISATEANNARYIKGAEAAGEKDGWTVSVVDAAGSADQANSAIQNFVQRDAAAIIDMVFPYSSIGAGLFAARSAHIPVVTWGGGIGSSVAATNGSGAPVAKPVIETMVADMGGKGDLLALTYRTGEVCRKREVLLDETLAKNPGIHVTKDEVRIPGYFEDGAQYANAWLAAHPPGSSNLAIWGCWDDPAIGAISALRQQGLYGCQGLWCQRQCSGTREYQGRVHDGHCLGRQLYGGLRHGDASRHDQSGRRKLAAEGGRGSSRARHPKQYRRLPQGPSRRFG